MYSFTLKKVRRENNNQNSVRIKRVFQLGSSKYIQYIYIRSAVNIHITIPWKFAYFAQNLYLYLDTSVGDPDVFGPPGQDPLVRV